MAKAKRQCTKCKKNHQMQQLQQVFNTAIAQKNNNNVKKGR